MFVHSSEIFNFVPPFEHVICSNDHSNLTKIQYNKSVGREFSVIVVRISYKCSVIGNSFFPHEISLDKNNRLVRSNKTWSCPCNLVFSSLIWMIFLLLYYRIIIQFKLNYESSFAKYFSPSAFGNHPIFGTVSRIVIIYFQFVWDVIKMPLYSVRAKAILHAGLKKRVYLFANSRISIPYFTFYKIHLILHSHKTYFYLKYRWNQRWVRFQRRNILYRY